MSGIGSPLGGGTTPSFQPPTPDPNPHIKQHGGAGGGGGGGTGTVRDNTTSTSDKTTDEAKVKVEVQNADGTTTTVEVDVEEAKQQKQQDDNSGGGQSGGGDGEGSNDTETITIDLTSTDPTLATGKTSRSEAIVTITMQDSLTSVGSTDKVTYFAHETTSGPPDQPSLPPLKPHDHKKVKAESQGNLWLASSFMVTMLVNMMLIAMIQKDIKKIENQQEVASIKYTWQAAKQLASDIMAKAAKEKSMYMMMAAVAIASFVVQCVGFGLSLKGASKTAEADEMEQSGKVTLKMQKPGRLNKALGIKEEGPTVSIHTEEGAAQFAKTKKAGAMYGHAGTFATQALGHAISDIGQNMIQAFMKYKIAESERDMEMDRAIQQMAQKMWDQAHQLIQDASQAYDQVMQALQKVQDEEKNAFWRG